ncbi:MAG TPA: periplasmic heavy metal sensor [Gemmataceae bacterium]|nr:periplasmic heavy metal sensor [Gemmataceae bacterium]
MGKSLLIALSIALNTAFVATWIVHALPAKSPEAASPSECPLRHALGLDDAAWKAFQARQAAFRERSSTQCRELNRLRSQLIDLLASNRPDTKAIDAKQKEIGTVQRRIQSLVLDYLLDEKQHLSVEQQQTLFDLIRKRCGCSGQDALMGQGTHVSGGPAAADDCGEK